MVLGSTILYAAPKSYMSPTAQWELTSTSSDCWHQRHTRATKFQIPPVWRGGLFEHLEGIVQEPFLPWQCGKTHHDQRCFHKAFVILHVNNASDDQLQFQFRKARVLFEWADKKNVTGNAYDGIDRKCVSGFHSLTYTYTCWGAEFWLTQTGSWTLSRKLIVAKVSILVVSG